MKAKARARANIALIKYWGKRTVGLNLPETGSISMTLSDSHTTTSVEFSESLKIDEILINDKEADEAFYLRAVRFLEMIRHKTDTNLMARVETYNNFPTASGLASSASGFAAFAAAASKAVKLSTDINNLAIWARVGSGSAPRSLLGGFVRLHEGEDSFGLDCLPAQIIDENSWDLNMVVAVTEKSAKKIGSTEGMTITKETSPFYKQWIEANSKRLELAEQAILSRDFHKLGLLTEESCFQMHASMMSSVPPIIYWNPATMRVIKRWEHDINSAKFPISKDIKYRNCPPLNHKMMGKIAYITIDAGPHVKLLCEAENAEIIAEETRKIEGVLDVYIEKPGAGIEFL